MSLFRRELVGLGISAERIACAVRARNDHRVRFHRAPLAATARRDTNDISEALNAVLADVPDARQRSCHVVLASDCLREWIMEVPPGVKSMRELQQTAAARFTQIYCESSEQWRVTADWRIRGPMLCTAAPLRLVEPLRLALEQRTTGFKMTTVTAIAISDAIATLPDPAWLCVRAYDHATILSITRGAIDLLRHVRTGRTETAAQLEPVAAEITRICLRSSNAAPSRVFVYDATGRTSAVTLAGGIEFQPVIGRLPAAVQEAAPGCDADIAAIMGESS